MVILLTNASRRQEKTSCLRKRRKGRAIMIIFFWLIYLNYKKGKNSRYGSVEVATGLSYLSLRVSCSESQ